MLNVLSSQLFKVIDPLGHSQHKAAQGGTSSKVLIQPILSLSELAGLLLKQGATAASAKVAAAPQQQVLQADSQAHDPEPQIN